MHASLGSTSPVQRRRLLIVVGIATLAMALALSSKEALNVWLTTGFVSGFVLLLGFSIHGAALWHLLRLSWWGTGLGISTGLLMPVMKTPPQQATGYQKEDDPEPTRSKLRGIAPKEIDENVLSSRGGLAAANRARRCRSVYVSGTAARSCCRTAGSPPPRCGCGRVHMARSVNRCTPPLLQCARCRFVQRRDLFASPSRRPFAYSVWCSLRLRYHLGIASRGNGECIGFRAKPSVVESQYIHFLSTGISRIDMTLQCMMSRANFWLYGACKRAV